MSKRFTAERRSQLAQKIISKGTISVGEAAKQFNVSTETIRKDFIFLEKEGIIKKSHGGAIPATEYVEKSIQNKVTENSDKKNKIALKALELIPAKGSIMLDGGTTTLALANLLQLEKDLTIFTNSSVALNVLANSDNNVFMFGGKVRPSSLSTVGKWTNEQIVQTHVDIAFIGTDGFENLTGPATHSYEEAEIKKNMIRSCKKSVILADSSKFSISSSFQFYDWKNIDILITDTFAPKYESEQIMSHTTVITT